MSQCVIILAPPRTGSSALAGALHRVGIDMGVGPGESAFAPFGTYEDTALIHLLDRCMGAWDTKMDPVAAYLTDWAYYVRCRSNGIVWGMKQARIIPTLPFMLNDLRGCDMSVIATYRRFHDAVDSLVRRGIRLIDAVRIQQFYFAGQRMACELFESVHTVNFEDLVSEPSETLLRLAQAIGIDADIQNAADFINYQKAQELATTFP